MQATIDKQDKLYNMLQNKTELFERRNEELKKSVDQKDVAINKLTIK